MEIPDGGKVNGNKFIGCTNSLSKGALYVNLALHIEHATSKCEAYRARLVQFASQDDEQAGDKNKKATAESKKILSVPRERIITFLECLSKHMTEANGRVPNFDDTLEPFDVEICKMILDASDHVADAAIKGKVRCMLAAFPPPMMTTNIVEASSNGEKRKVDAVSSDSSKTKAPKKQ
jgi:hypothetical protein